MDRLDLFNIISNLRHRNSHAPSRISDSRSFCTPLLINKEELYIDSHLQICWSFSLDSTSVNAPEFAHIFPFLFPYNELSSQLSRFSIAYEINMMCFQGWFTHKNLDSLQHGQVKGAQWFPIKLMHDLVEIHKFNKSNNFKSKCID